MVSVVQEAIRKIRKITSEARCIAQWYEDQPGKIYLRDEIEYLRGREWVSMQELADILGFNRVNSSNAWYKTYGISTVKNNGKRLVRFSDVEKTVVGMLPRSFPVMVKDSNCKYSEALFVVRVNELGAQRSIYNCMFESITIDQINTGLGGRAEHGYSSIFSRFGFTESDGSPINVSTHQFRHYLNTLAQAGGLSQLDIAKWSGRKNIRQNAAYDHVTPGQMVQKIRDAIGDDSIMFGPLAELSKKTLIPRDEFARLVVPTAHTTELGYCIHDYTMSPCQLQMDCIHCTDLICVKGDVEKEGRLRQLLEEARNLMQRAEDAKKDGYYGSDRWLEHHKTTVERLSQLCSIIDDPKVPIGSLIQLSASKPPARQVEMQRRLDAADGTSLASSLTLSEPISGEE